MKGKKMFTLPFVPKADHKNGLLCIFDRETETETLFAYCDMLEGVQEYEYPPSAGRKIMGIFIKVA
jgi:hypothetical protein